MKVDLKIRSPTHIGSGTTLNKHEYLFDEDQASVPDLDAYFREHPDEIQAFVAAMERGAPVGEFFDHTGQYSRYTLSSWVSSGSIGNSQVSVAIKDGTGSPYIPGTSLKGWIRTALAYRLLTNGSHLNRTDGNSVEEHFRVGDEGPRHDLLRCVTVRDTEPVSTDRLALCETKTYSLQRSGTLRKKHWSNYAECLVDGTELTTEILVDAPLLNRLVDRESATATARAVFGDDLSEEGMLATISAALEQFQAVVRREDQRLIDTEGIVEFYSTLPTTGPFFRIGFGTGHHSKTVSLALSETKRINANIEAGLKHADCGGSLRKDRRSTSRLFCSRCSEGDIVPNFENVVRFPKTREFVLRNGSPYAPLGWIEASLRGPL
ncbi:type III-A CRISPR-associated RAMP protein Csm5 [Halocatena pleomorpha]|uniref:CRISPR system Cms protein Csm5 n=1 Tax=Halocatena pleomorpha TaxID=1785090 RepID=A0A3P3RCQ2_9EURY|nr:type III-A CRISPR-associated RAMP protein Csm5 [Halocatena pleomorpha]RRJ30243.1 type III-A CRISPR-associated RAMP protein Csm5 [Halocatena pleomorpha]